MTASVWLPNDLRKRNTFGKKKLKMPEVVCWQVITNIGIIFRTKSNNLRYYRVQYESHDRAAPAASVLQRQKSIFYDFLQINANKLKMVMVQ